MSLSDQSINMATTTDDGEPPHKKQKREVLECGICRNDIDSDDYLRPCRDCKIIYCYVCVEKTFETALQDRRRFPARCCRVLHPGQAEGLLKPAEMMRYKARFDEDNTTNPLYCPVPTCSTFISRRIQRVVDGKLSCPACGCEACIKCKNVASDGHDCSRKEVEKIARRFGYKLCPRCGAGVARMWGCAHMQCNCGAHWCWHCQRPMDVCERDCCDRRWDEDENGPHRLNEEDSVLENEGQPATELVAIDPATIDPATIDPSFTGPLTAEPAAPVTAAIETSTTDAVANEPAAAASTSKPSAEAEAVVNLDDPDAEDWQNMDLDLNDEPGNDLTIFGCFHYFREFGLDAVPHQWLKGLDKRKGTVLECMACFKPINVRGTLVSEQETKKKNKASKKMLAYDCRECGVIYCWGCREGAMELQKNNV